MKALKSITSKQKLFKSGKVYNNLLEKKSNSKKGENTKIINGEKKNNIVNTNKLKLDFFKTKSLKKQLILSCILLVSIPVLIVSTYSYISTRKTLVNKVMDLNTQTTKQMNLNFTSFLAKIPNATFATVTQYDVSTYIPSTDTEVESSVENTRSKIISHLESTKKNVGLNDYFIVYDNGDFLGFPQTSALLQTEKSDLYKELEGFAGKNGSWITGYKDNYDVMIFVRKVNSNGILISSMYTDKLTLMFNNIIDTNIQKVDIINDTNVIIYSSDVEEIGQPIHTGIVERLKNEEDSFIHDKNLVTYNSTNGFKLINTVSGEYVFSEINRTNLLIVVISILCILVAIIIGALISTRIVDPILKIVSLMKNVESGDFTVKAEYESKSELGVLSNSFNVMVQNINLLVTNIIAVSNSIEQRIENIKSIATDSTVASQQVASAIEEIAAGSSEQAIQAEDTIGIINKLAISINDVTGSIGSVSRTTDNTKVIGNGSLKMMKDLEMKTIETDKTLRDITLTIKNLINSVNNIESFLKIINDISNQSNLLSLNASIEAAHAGEFGKGFAVVAREVKKLAEQSKKSTSEIAKVIHTIQRQTKLATALLEDSAKIFDEQKTAVEYTSDSFKEILVATEKITGEVDNVINLVNGMNSLKENSIQAIKVIASVSEESSATTEEVTASTQEQTALSEELSNLTIELFNESQTLKDSIGKFKINN